MPNQSITKQKLIDLGEQIAQGAYPHDAREWEGADVVIERGNPGSSGMPRRSAQGFYPEPRVVRTLFSNELSWLFTALRDIFHGHFDGCTKIEFYGRLANMATRYQARLKGTEEQEEDLLRAVLHEAFSILEEMEEGCFCYLPVAVGNTIFDDLIDRADSEGYLSVEETQALLREIEGRDRDAV